MERLGETEPNSSPSTPAVASRTAQPAPSSPTPSSAACSARDWQEPTRGAWLTEVLSGGVAEALRERGLRLYLEPGRSLVDGCGLTLAEVAFTKTRSDGVPVVGLAMNRTRCRTTSDNFLIDPYLVKRTPPSEEIEAFLVGAYCIEDELILRRKIRFPRGVAREALGRHRRSLTPVGAPSAGPELG